MLCLVSCHLLSLSPDRYELLEKINTAKFSKIFKWEQTGGKITRPVQYLRRESP